MKTDAEFTTVYNKYFNLVLSYLKGRFNLSTADAEDFTQDTFIKARANFDRNPGGFDPSKGALPQWLCSVGWQICADAFRTSKSKYVTSADAMEEPVEGISHLDADSEITNTEIAQAIKSALLELSYKNRMVAVLRLFNHKSTKEVAEIMDIPLNSVLVTIQRVKAQLKGKPELQQFLA